MGGCFGSLGAEPPKAIGGPGAKPPAAGGWGQSLQPPEAWRFGGGAPNARKFCILLNFRAILKKIMRLKRGIEISRANMIKLVA